MRRVLLTGGTGFVGRQVLKRLLETGCLVRLLVRRPVRDVPPQVEPLLLDDLFSASNRELVEACADIDTVVHAAWYVEPGTYLESPHNVDCLMGTLRLGQAAAEAYVRRFVGVGTCFEYDLSARYLRVTTPLAPSTLYGCAKVSAFLMLSRLMAAGQVSFSWCRLFYLHGEGEDARRLGPYLHARLAAGEQAELTSGNQIRDFLDVTEAGRRIADAALSKIEGPLNICSGNPLTVAEFAYRIADKYGRRELLRFGALPDRPSDPPCVIGEPGTW